MKAWHYIAIVALYLLSGYGFYAAIPFEAAAGMTGREFDKRRLLAGLVLTLLGPIASIVLGALCVLGPIVIFVLGLVDHARWEWLER